MGEGNQRNKKCLCGSGKKYKKCCIYRARNFPDSRVVELHAKTFKKARPKFCLMKDFGDCNRVIKAHSIQRNGPLKDISSNGLVMGFNHDDLLKRGKFTEMGLSKASTFKGVCDKHDKIFSDIEEKEYERTSRQATLLALRGVLYELYKKYHILNHLDEVNNVINDMGSGATIDPRVDSAMKLGLSNGIANLTEDLERIRKIIQSEKYGEIMHFDVLIPKRSNFTTSAVFGPLFNIDGNQKINDLIERVKPLFLNVFNGAENTYVILCWFEIDNDRIKLLIDDLRKLDTNQQKEVINNMIAYHIENVFVCPEIWNKLPVYKRNKFENLFFHKLGDGLNFSNYLGQQELNLFDL